MCLPVYDVTSHIGTKPKFESPDGLGGHSRNQSERSEHRSLCSVKIFTERSTKCRLLVTVMPNILSQVGLRLSGSRFRTYATWLCNATV